MDAQELWNLQEAYMEVYRNLDEEGATSQRLADLANKRIGDLPPTHHMKVLQSAAQQREHYDLYDIILSHLLDEELTGERKERALKKGGYLANRVATGREGQPVERRNRSGDITMRTTTKAPTKRGGGESKKVRKSDWSGWEADRGSGNKAARRESYDLYDIILSHLLDEGYAETPEAAEVIMVNMSEEWRENICEELTGERRKRALEKGTPLATRVARAKEGQPRERTGPPYLGATKKAPIKRGGIGDRGRGKSEWTGYESDRGSGNKAARRAGIKVRDTSDEL